MLSRGVTRLISYSFISEWPYMCEKFYAIFATLYWTNGLGDVSIKVLTTFEHIWKFYCKSILRG